MRKLFLLWSIITATIFAVGCTDDTVNDDNKPTPPPTVDPTTPEISVTEVEVTANSFTFEIATNVAGEFGYCYVKDGFDAPAFHEWFAMNSGEVEDKSVVTIENLDDNTAYHLYIVLRSKSDNIYSDPKSLSFTTLDDGVDNPITVDNVTYDRVTFTINIPGDYLFQCIDKAYLEYVNQSPETYISTLGIGIPSSGVQTYEWFDGGTFGNYEMRLREDSDYYVIAAISDGKQNVIGDIFLKEFKTPKKPHSNAGITTEFIEIGATTVTISTTPDSTVMQYYVYVRDKVWAESIIGGYGESMLATLVKSPSAGAWTLTTANEDTWTGLAPETDYYCMVLVIDDKGAEALSLIEFQTAEKQLAAPSIDMSITEAATNPHNTLNLNIYSELAASGKIVFRPSADIASRRNSGYTDEQIVNNYGIDLSGDQISAISTTGLSIVMNDLWPETEYTAMVSIKNSELTETMKITTHTTPKQAAAPRVESELFTSLLGEWRVTYSIIQRNLVETTISDVVTIAQGVDAKTEADYRAQNRLVVIGMPFEADAQGNYTQIPFYTPADLISESDYYAKHQSLAYRDYGPKIFFEIANGDVVTVPTSKGEYLYNWSADGILNFYGCDYNNKQAAPVAFPVTVSADGNTITIGACHTGAEFYYGIYRPAVFLNDDLANGMRMVATSDIVFTRVK